MNCREAQNRIFAERDGTLEANERAALDGHLAQCDACRKVRAGLAAAITSWQNEATAAQVPDAEREWHAVRRRIRHESAPAARRPLFTWLVLPLGVAAAAAVAFTLFVPSTVPTVVPAPIANATQVARVDAVEAPGNNASTMVFVDEKSGWLIVWASDAAPKRG
ncbi:zf-HC2 domain-containing protein [Horticoccus sp. 23ND18S-11]|uniref:zf-HC2 domain-containing protein n=1 Tax=Horticoccus sp. 23ND18S-11 TaxID=3391832 RepID=UPI0039C9574A